MYTMLQSINSTFDQVEILLQRKGKLDLLKNVKQELLSEIVEVLEPFKDATEELEKFKEPTIHQVLYFRHELQKHLQDTKNNSPNIKALKKSLLHEFQRKWEYYDLHIAAAILCPLQKGNLKDFTGLEKEEIDKGLAFIKKTIKRGNFELNESQCTNSIQMESSRSTKRLRFSNVLHSYNKTIDQESEMDPIDREISKYMSFEFQIDCSNYDLLEFWRANSKNFKYLSYAARCLLAIPASSSKCECDFSVTGRIKTKARASLSPESLENLLIIRTNADLYNESV
jgi:hypothetical protein